MHRQHYLFCNILKEGDQPPWNHGWVQKWGYCTAKQLYSFPFYNRIGKEEANTNGNVMWQTLHYYLLLVEDLKYLLSVIPYRTNARINCWDALHRVWYIEDACSNLTPVQHVVSSKADQYLLNQNVSFTTDSMIYMMAKICWSQQVYLESGVSTYKRHRLYLTEQYQNKNPCQCHTCWLDLWQQELSSHLTVYLLLSWLEVRISLCQGLWCNLPLL